MFLTTRCCACDTDFAQQRTSRIIAISRRSTGGAMSNDPARKMLLAIESGDLASVQALVGSDPALATTIVDDGDPLGWAAFYAHPHIVKYLIGRGVDVNWRTARGT